MQGTLAEPTVARPRTWGDCLRAGWGAEEPCPWVSCSHHLLIDLRRSKKGGDGIRLYGVRYEGAPRVERPTSEQAMEDLAERAIAALWGMGESCALRASERVRSMREIAEVLVVSPELVRQRLVRAALELKSRGIDAKELDAFVDALLAPGTDQPTRKT